MQGRTVVGSGGEEPAMWLRIWATTRREREEKGEDNKWDGKKKKRYTRCQRPGTTDHPHHLGTDVTVFLSRPQQLTKTFSLINIYTPPFCFDNHYAFRATVDEFCFFALGVVAESDVCYWFIFSFGVVVDECYRKYLFTPGYYFLLGEPHPPTNTHPSTLRGFCANAHRFPLKCCWVVGGGWCTCVTVPVDIYIYIFLPILRANRRLEPPLPLSYPVGHSVILL